MKNQDLDDLIRRKLNVSSRVPDNLWSQIETALDEANDNNFLKPTLIKNKNHWWMKVAAVIAGGLMVGGALYTYNWKDNNSKSPLIVKENNNNFPSNPNSIVQKDSIQTNTIQPLNRNANHNGTHASNIAVNPQYSIAHSQISNSEVNRLENNIIESSAKKVEWIALSDLSNLVSIQKLPIHSDNEIFENLPSPIQIIQSNGNKNPDIDKYFIAEAKNHDPKINIDNGYNNDILLGVSGGFNYGSLKNGGTVAMNTRKQLSNNLYIDGSIGFVMNNSSSSQNNFKGDFIAFKQIRQTSQLNKFSTQFNNLMESSNPFYFVQINPSIGINLTKRIDISVGPDYQQMISNINYDVVNFADDSKLLPRHDFGLTGKAEMSLNKNLKAGILLREGFTSLINNNSNLSDRRYFQVQLKYQLPYSKNN